MIALETKPRQGVRFIVHLPGTQPSETADAVIPADIPRGCERLILVDINPKSRPPFATFRCVLLRLGDRVEAYSSPLIALANLKPRPEGFDLLIADMVIPGLSGDALATEVRMLRPDADHHLHGP